jgi:hypothetical protein
VRTWVSRLASLSTDDPSCVLAPPSISWTAHVVPEFMSVRYVSRKIWSCIVSAERCASHNTITRMSSLCAIELPNPVTVIAFPGAVAGSVGIP